MIKEWLDFFATEAAGVLAFIFLFEGTRLLRTYGTNRIAVLMVAYGAIFSFASAGFLYWKHVTSKEITQTLPRMEAVDPLPADWKKDLEPQKREEASLALARMVFFDSGKFNDYFDKHGQRQRFSPSEEDIKHREWLVVTQARLEDAVRDNLNHALGWLIWALMAVALGFMFARHGATPKRVGPAQDIDSRK